MKALDTLLSMGFSPWFTQQETDWVGAHVNEKFEQITYHKIDKPDKPLYGLLNTETNEVMFHEPPCVVRFKCFMILIGNPLHMISRFAFRLIKGVVLVAIAVFQLDREKICKEILEILKVPAYGLGIELAALIGLFYDPYRGRERIGLLEKKLNDGKSYDEEGTFFLARCCQPWRMYDEADESVYKTTDRKPLPQDTPCIFNCCLAAPSAAEKSNDAPDNVSLPD